MTIAESRSAALARRARRCAVALRLYVRAVRKDFVLAQWDQRGAGRTLEKPLGASEATDLFTTATSFRLPYYVIQGRHDLSSPTPLVEVYFNTISAPKKRLIIIEDAGHFALATHQAGVIAALKAIIH